MDRKLGSCRLTMCGGRTLVVEGCINKKRARYNATGCHVFRVGRRVRAVRIRSGPPAFQATPTALPTPSCGACPAPAKATLHRAPPGSGALRRARTAGRGGRQGVGAKKGVWISDLITVSAIPDKNLNPGQPFASSAGVLLPHTEATRVADAMIEAWISYTYFGRCGICRADRHRYADTHPTPGRVDAPGE
jgi:hypothetical protein